MYDSTTCVSYSFASTQLPTGLVVDNPQVMQPNLICGALEITMPPGNNDLATELRIRLKNETVTSPLQGYNVTAAYDVIAQGPGSWVGVEAYAVDRYVRGETQPPSFGMAGDEVFLRTNVSPATVGMFPGTEVGLHTMKLAAIGSAAGVKYSFTVDQVSANPAQSAFATAPARAFYVGNSTSSVGIQNGVTVRLYQLVFCP